MSAIADTYRVVTIFTYPTLIAASRETIDSESPSLECWASASGYLATDSCAVCTSVVIDPSKAEQAKKWRGPDKLDAPPFLDVIDKLYKSVLKGQELLTRKYRLIRPGGWLSKWKGARIDDNTLPPESNAAKRDMMLQVRLHLSFYGRLVDRSLSQPKSPSPSSIT